MTKCEQLQMKIDEYMTKAIQETDVNLKAFYFNASRCVEMKRDQMTVEELSEEV